jgi:hypothetical protein
MSYVAFGNNVAATCARLQTMMPGTDTYMPGQICGEASGKTGHDPPRPRICDGIGAMDVQNALKLAGLYNGPVDDSRITPEFLAAIGAIAAAYNVPWDGDLWSVGPNLCGAIIAEVSKRAPSCSAEYGITQYETGCVAKPTGPLMDPLPPGQPPPPEPPSGSGVSVSRRLQQATSMLRHVTAGKPAIQRARDPYLAQWMGDDVGTGQPTNLPVVPAPSSSEGIPTWVIIAGGVVVAGGVAYFVIKRKK